MGLDDHTTGNTNLDRLIRAKCRPALIGNGCLDMIFKITVFTMNCYRFVYLITKQACVVTCNAVVYIVVYFCRSRAVACRDRGIDAIDRYNSATNGTSFLFAKGYKPNSHTIDR